MQTAIVVGTVLAAGAVVGFLVVRRRWAERAARLARWNGRLTALLAAGPAWAGWLQGSRFRYVTPGFAVALGRSQEACTGLGLEELFEPAEVVRLRRRESEPADVGSAWRTEMRLPGRSERVPVEITAVLTSEQAGGAAGWGLVLRDLRDAPAPAAEERRQRLDGLLAAISGELLRAESRELHGAIERALGMLGEFAEADRASTRVIDDHDPDLVRRCQLWVRPGADVSRSPDELSVADAPGLLRQLRAGRVVRIPAEEPAEAGDAFGASLLARAGVRAAVVFPLRVQGELFGGCVLAWERRACPLAAEDTTGLQLAADALGSALARERAGRALRRQEELLLQAQRMEAVGALAGGIAHDFNNLLTVINGYAETLRASPGLSEGERAQVEQIARAGERAAALTSRLLAFGRRQRREPRLLDLGERVAALEPILRRSLGESIALAIERQPALPLVQADSAQLDQVLLNLVFNARDAVGERGHIAVRTRSVASASPAVCLEVEDDGCGIAEEHRDRIFEPFFTTKAVGQGTGLGLAMVHGIVHQGGGSIEVESEVGAGTRFRVLLPVAEGAVADPPTPLPTPRVPQGAKGRILLVEDEQAVRDLAAYSLRAAGFVVLTAADGEEGLQLAQEDERGFDAIVTDVVMPNRSGPEMVAQLPSRYREVPILYISGYHRDGGGDRLGVVVPPGGSARVFEKPFTPQQLVEQLTSLLRG